MSLISQLPTTSVDEQDKRGLLRAVSGGWRNFFTAVFSICTALTQSGTTANRPSDGLWVGRMYFDTTLGLPVWYNGVTWVDSTGAPA